MIGYLDKTFCASPNCKNDCGRKMTEEETKGLEKWNPLWGISYGFFCGEPNSNVITLNHPRQYILEDGTKSN